MSRPFGLLYSRLAPLVCVFCLLFPGLLGMIALDVGHSPDVWTHTYRVSGILNGDVIARPVTSVSRYHSTPDQNVGGAVDLGLVELSVEHFNNHDTGSVLPESIVVADERTADVPYNNTAVYSPAAYPVQLAAFALGGALELEALTTYYLAEAMMLIVWTVLGTAGILALPRYRRVALAVALFPGMWFPYSFAISADSLALALCLLFACLTVRALDNPSRGNLAMLGVVGLMLACGKFSNAPLFAIPLAIPMIYRHAGRSGRFPSGTGALVACFVLAVVIDVVWLRLGTSGYATSPGVVSYEVVSARSAKMPMTLLEALSHIVYSVLHVEGAYLLGREGVAAFWLGLLAGTMLVVVTFARVGWNSQDRRARPALWLWCCVVVLGTALISYFALWLQYTPDGAPGVMGVQYRYFMPFVPLAAIMVTDCVRLLRERRISRA